MPFVVIVMNMDIALAMLDSFFTESQNMFFIFGVSFTLGLSGALMPGPVLTVTINEASKRGFRNGALVPIGHAALELVVVVLLVIGLSEVMNLDIVTGLVGLLGGVFLLWMGRAILKSTLRRGSISLLDSDTKDVRWKVGPFASGVLTSLSNPYWLVWWATVGSAYLVFSAQYGLIGVLIFYVGHILSDISWYCFVAYALAHGRSVISDKVYNRILGICGVFLLLLGVYFLYYGLTTLF